MAARLLGSGCIGRPFSAFDSASYATPSLPAGSRASGGRLNDPQRLATAVEAIVQDVVEHWLPQQRRLARPVLDSWPIDLRLRIEKSPRSASPD